MEFECAVLCIGMNSLFITEETVGCGYATISVDGHLDSFPIGAPLSRSLGTFK